MRRRGRGGFTLLELLVALVLLDLGLIALSAASAAVSRIQAGAQSDSRAQELAATRVERILSSRCGNAAAGTSRPAPNIVEGWSDLPAPNGVRYVADSLVVAAPRGARVVVLHTAGRC